MGYGSAGHLIIALGRLIRDGYVEYQGDWAKRTYWRVDDRLKFDVIGKVDNREIRIDTLPTEQQAADYALTIDMVGLDDVFIRPAIREAA